MEDQKFLQEFKVISDASIYHMSYKPSKELVVNGISG